MSKDIYQFFGGVLKNWRQTMDEKASKRNRCPKAKGWFRRHHDLISTGTYTADFIYEVCHWECRLCGKKFVSDGTSLLAHERTIRPAS